MLPFFLLLHSDKRDESPDRRPAGDRVAAVSFEPVTLPPLRTAEGQVAGAWRVEVDDPRFGGVSALALTPTGLLALTDSGVAVELPKPRDGARARIRDLPDGPGYPSWKIFRDSEALARVERGWWVGFEFRHSLWLFDSGLGRALREVSLSRLGWPRNKGVEAMVADQGGLLILPESGRSVVKLGQRGATSAPLAGGRGQVADAARLSNGTILVLVREVSLTGIRNRVARLEATGNGYRLSPLFTLPLGRFDNAEALAAEPLPSGATRLWIMTDDDFSGWRDTLLVALDLPTAGGR